MAYTADIFISMSPTDQEIISACKTEPTMAQAARKLDINYKTLRKRAKTLGVFQANQPGRGIEKGSPGHKISLAEILAGKHPKYQTNKLRIRLIKEEIKEKKCEVCGIIDWNGKKLSFELDHVDGNKRNHKLENLRIVCPNCHSQTETYRGKNIRGRAGTGIRN